jgi:hypothetical protein
MMQDGIKILNNHLIKNFDLIKYFNPKILLKYITIYEIKTSSKLQFNMFKKENFINNQIVYLGKNHKKIEINELLILISSIGLHSLYYFDITFFRNRERYLKEC